jgi:hypothetical protein
MLKDVSEILSFQICAYFFIWLWWLLIGNGGIHISINYSVLNEIKWYK